MSNATKNYMKNGGSEWVVGGKLVIAPGGSVEGLPQNGNGGESTYNGELLKNVTFESPNSLGLSGTININATITTINPSTNLESSSTVTIAIPSKLIKDAYNRTENSF